MNLLNVVGDALWIVSLSIQAAASRAAWGRIAPGTPTPLVLGLRAPRAVALCLVPAIAFVVGAGLLVLYRDAAPWSDEAWLLFGVRATAAALFALAHLRWLTGALATLGREGALKP
jgi:hypothetical protein